LIITCKGTETAQAPYRTNICLSQDQPSDVLKSLDKALRRNYVDSAEGFYTNTEALRKDNLLNKCYKQY